MAGATDGCKRRRAPSSEAQTRLAQRGICTHNGIEFGLFVVGACAGATVPAYCACCWLAALALGWAGLAGWLVPWPSLPAALVALNSRKGRPGRSAHILTYLTTLGEVSPSPASRQIIIYLF